MVKSKMASSDAHDLYGAAPDKSPVALLLIDVINDFEFEDGAALLEHAAPAAEAIAALKRRARALGIPAIYVNDNFGRWKSDFQSLVRHCLEDGVRGASFVRCLQPDVEDYFVLKPKHSGFFETPLQLLLQYLGARAVILTGLTTNICVLFTANDVYMRDLELYVPRDCAAAVREEEHAYALEQIEIVLKADTSPSTALDLEKMVANTAGQGVNGAADNSQLPLR